MKILVALAIVSAALVSPTVAFAYVGPGVGLSLLGALWALVAAIGTALFLVLAWPVRRWLRRRRESVAQMPQPGPPSGNSAALRERPRS